MEESHRGASCTSDTKKKNLSIDDEIRKDFLNSWKLTANEKAEIEFTNENPSRGRKTMFDFDKLDDLEFGEGFGKMPSFQMDMSDLDFSSSPKKIEKAIEKSEKDFSHEKRKNKQEMFTFSFDFNELEGFGLDSNFLKGRKKFENDTDNKRSDFCNKSDNGHNSDGTSTTNTSGIQKGLKDMTKSDGAISEISGYMAPHTVVDVVRHGTCTALKNKCSKEIFNLDKQITVSQGNKTDDKKSERQKEKQCIPASETLNAEKVPQVLLIQSTDVLPLEADEVDLLVHKSDVEKGKSRELPGSPDSRNSSSANAPSLENAFQSCNSDASGFGGLDQSDLNHDSLDDKRTEQMMNVGITPVASKPAGLTKTEEKHGSGPKIVLPSLCRESSSDAQQAVPKISFLKPLNGEVKQTGQASQKGCISKNLSGEVTKQNQQAFHKFNSSKTLFGEEPIQRLAIPENDGHMKESPISGSPKQTTTYIGTLNSMPKLGDQAHLKPSKISSVEKYGLSSITNNSKHDTSRLSLKTNTSNSTNQKKSSLISISDMNTGRKSPKLASTEMKEKHATLCPSLKRKSYEGSIADSASLKSFKGSSESPNGKRIIIDTSPKTKEQLVLISKDNEACPRDAFPGPQNSPSSIPIATSVLDIDVQVNLEDDENVQKAEACTKELEDICNMLKKKHEEAKDLLVRAVVSNNLLLMLNHPIHEEKIRNLQKLAGRLVSEDYKF